MLILKNSGKKIIMLIATMRHLSALKYYCPLSAVSNSHVQKDAAMPLYPLGAADLLTHLRVQRPGHTYSHGRGHNPPFTPSTRSPTRSPPAAAAASLPKGEALQQGNSTNTSIAAHDKTCGCPSGPAHALLLM